MRGRDRNHRAKAMKRVEAITLIVMTRVQKRFHLRAVEWLLSVITITLGLELSLFPNLFASQAYYAELQRFAPQSCWALALLLAGFGRFGALVINGAWRFSPHARVVTALFNGLVWLEIGFGLLHLGRPSLGLIICPWFVLADGYSIFRASGDASIADNRAKVAAASHEG